ncbi:hypothetical protein P691DRAFT_699608 [Macrolepiota fuliginosa MF-IS2]|uniref:DBF4-type domain-containing protein n=1 Tax=Macrolepiota fuliginosa MF-IS2 TaxID=1400762 RepID=A0A9P5XK79_9AGAR|nr:hypothetical protein P691DRAFT_699608 [Macrolepiota fuliginosa MF-IS2]
MTSVNRRPLATRPPQSLVPSPSPARHLKSTQLPKRPRSPDPTTHNLGSLIKRHKPIATSTNAPSLVKRERKPENSKLKEQQRAEREQQRLEFKEKYCRAFPHWIFHLDTESMESGHQLELFQSRIQHLGGKLELFFSRETTHLISNRPIPNQPAASEKENTYKGRMSNKPVQTSKSPVKIRSRQQEDQEPTDLIGNALKFNIKIWSTAKLESVLSRCLEEPSTTTASLTSTSKQRNPTLSKLLQSERIYGLSERDPTQKRHDYRYFSRGSHFVLIEDIHGELATIAAHEYPPFKEREGEKSPWPTLYCHPRARGPFIPFDDREKRRWERQQLAERKENEERSHRETLLRKQLMEKRTDTHLLARKPGDLRRSASMNNMRNANIFENPGLDHDGEGDVFESTNASGYLASGLMGYMAASGNSVGITSTTGTTSTANYTSRNLQIPSNLSGRMRLEVVMRKQPQEKSARANAMAPPADVPPRSLVLRKSKSTNTLKLPKREEGSKPGYCESCRQKFDDFKEHIQGRRHRKFAEDNDNFLTLDYILNRVQRRTLAERHALDQQRLDVCLHALGQDTDSDSEPILVED